MRGWWENHKDRTQPPTGDHTPPLVVIHWWDAISYGTDNWTDETDQPEPCPTVNVGWLTHNTPEAVTIVPLVNTHQWGNGITIPWGCIHTLTPITPPDKPPTRRRNRPTK